MGESSTSEKEETMSRKPLPCCSECKVTMRSGKANYVYRDDGIAITIPDVPAYLCGRGHEPLFTPESTDQLIETLKELVATARRARKRRPRFREYRVQVA